MPGPILGSIKSESLRVWPGVSLFEKLQKAGRVVPVGNHWAGAALSLHLLPPEGDKGFVWGRFKCLTVHVCCTLSDTEMPTFPMQMIPIKRKKEGKTQVRPIHQSGEQHTVK